jgi:hypothetical protein
MKNITKTVLVLIVFINIACNKETADYSQRLVAQNEADIETGLPPIINFERSCNPKELIRNNSTIEGYTDKQSYAVGERVFFYIHSRTPSYSFELYRFGQNQQLIYSENRNDGAIQNYLCYSYSHGCDWSSTFNYALSGSLRTGYYSAKIENENGSSWITFIVKPFSKTSDIALIASTFTWCAYNDWGGGSFYTNRIEEESPVSENLAFLRPNPSASPFENSHLTGSELHLVKWLEQNNYAYDQFSDVDLHESPDDIKKYKTIIIQTHPEYYSQEMYSALLEYINEGGHLMYLGANGIYSKVVFNPLLKILETRKTGGTHFYEESQGGLWRDLELHESSLIGVQYDRRGYNTYRPYKVKNASHWVYSNTNLKNDDTFGESCGRDGASGHETDKITNFSPTNIIHLAKGTNSDNGGADMIYYENNNGGKVFSVGSITYTSCINDDPVISQITENVLNEFLK